MNHQFQFVAGMPHLDVSSLMEDWAVAAGFESHWKLLAQSLSLHHQSGSIRKGTGCMPPLCI